MWHSKEHVVEPQLFPKLVDCCVFVQWNTASFALFCTIGSVYPFQFGKQPHYTVRLISSMRIGLHGYFLIGKMLFQFGTLPIEPLHTITVVLNSHIVLKSNFHFCLLLATMDAWHLPFSRGQVETWYAAYIQPLCTLCTRDWFVNYVQLQLSCSFILKCTSMTSKWQQNRQKNETYNNECPHYTSN